MNGDVFREEMLRVMEAKEHWAWPLFNSGFVAPELLHIHLEQEYATYVCDFAVLVGRAYVQCPVEPVRAELAENIYEEETGGLVAGRPHAQLFLDYPRGLSMDLSRFERVELLPESRRYRDIIDELTLACGWEVAAAVTTIFLEGTKWDRGEIDQASPKRPAPPLDDHPLVKHYGLPLEHLSLTKAHRAVEGLHREAAWKIILDHVEPEARLRVLNGMHECLEAWLRYRDNVAQACGLERAEIEEASA